MAPSSPGKGQNCMSYLNYVFLLMKEKKLPQANFGGKRMKLYTSLEQGISMFQ